jgi:hypothetical protein
VTPEDEERQPAWLAYAAFAGACFWIGLIAWACNR